RSKLFVSQQRLEKSAEPVLVEIGQLRGDLRQLALHIVRPGYFKAAAGVVTFRDPSVGLSDLGLLRSCQDVQVHGGAEVAEFVAANLSVQPGKDQVAGQV